MNSANGNSPQIDAESNKPDALGILTWHYENPMAAAVARHREGFPVVGFTSNTVPWELACAAGMFPVILGVSESGQTAAADAYMEAGVFEQRMRCIFSDVVAGTWQFLSLLVIPRTSEQENKLYLYLREVGRRHRDGLMPRIYLYDLLHARSSLAYAYGFGRTERLKQRLEEAAGRPIGISDLEQAISEANLARKAIRTLLNLRRGEPRLGGVEALALIGACYFMDRRQYARLAIEAAEIVARRPPIHGARLMVSGSSLHHRTLHRELEAHGAIVVAEDDWWGSRSAGDDIGCGDDILKGIFEKYYLDSPSPRVFPLDAADSWFQAAAVQVDGVVFYLSPEDGVAGWDYPRRRRFLENRGIPSLVVRGPADSSGFSPEWQSRIEQFVHRLPTG